MDAALDPDHDDDSSHNNNNHNNNYYYKDRMVESMTRELQALGVAEVQGVELRTLSEGGAIDLLHNAACVYLEQGNTYYLLYQIRRTGLDQAILAFLAPSTTTATTTTNDDDECECCRTLLPRKLWSGWFVRGCQCRVHCGRTHDPNM
jgi:hypothetical protein